MLDGTLKEIPSSTVRNGEVVELSEYERFDLGLLAYRKNLKAFACSLARDVEIADDLVQETILKAIVNRDKFDFDTNLRAWLFTILRHLFLSAARKQARSAELTYSISNCSDRAVGGAQEDRLFLKEVVQALRALPSSQRNAILRVGVLGTSVSEVALEEKCRPGTVKSRVNRGRKTLAKQLC